MSPPRADGYAAAKPTDAANNSLESFLLFVQEKKNSPPYINLTLDEHPGDSCLLFEGVCLVTGVIMLCSCLLPTPVSL